MKRVCEKCANRVGMGSEGGLGATKRSWEVLGVAIGVDLSVGSGRESGVRRLLNPFRVRGDT